MGGGGGGGGGGDSLDHKGLDWQDVCKRSLDTATY